jgi:hypothetical protein
MTERKALVLTFAGMLSLYGALFVGLRFLGASNDLQGLVYILVLCGGAYASSSVVMHYGSKRRRR